MSRMAPEPEGGRSLVSIIVPSYNQGRFIGQTLQSILAQDYRPLEVLVLDGASKDETVEVLRDFAARHPELRWWSEPDRGVAGAVNKGLARARGEYAGIQSSDDLYLPDAVTAAVSALADPGVGLAYGDAYPVDAEGRRCGPDSRWPAFTQARFLSRETFIHQSSAFFRLALARELGGWREDYFVADVDLWLRMTFRTRVRKIDRVMSAFRLHEAQRDKQVQRIWTGYWRLIGDSPDVRAAPLRLRLAADAGRRLVTASYNPRSAAFRTYQLWRALLTYPPAWRALPDKALLLPGARRLRAWLGVGAAR
jgi:glycosyltransferase involved in cell wall biosynthesis